MTTKSKKLFAGDDDEEQKPLAGDDDEKQKR
jgi:hypothetical protein